MKLIIEARVEDDGAAALSQPVTLAVVERKDTDLVRLGLSLAEGRALLATAQSVVVSCQTSAWAAANACCARCHAPLLHKDSRSILLRTVFGKVAVPSPRLWACACEGSRSRQRSISPLSRALTKRVTPELEYLQVKWAAHLPYAAATRLLKEVLPLQTTISATGAKKRARTVGRQLDARIKCEIAAMPTPVAVPRPRESRR